MTPEEIRATELHGDVTHNQLLRELTAQVAEYTELQRMVATLNVEMLKMALDAAKRNQGRLQGAAWSFTKDMCE
jgi:hypothetical protein